MSCSSIRNFHSFQPLLYHGTGPGADSPGNIADRSLRAATAEECAGDLGAVEGFDLTAKLCCSEWAGPVRHADPRHRSTHTYFGTTKGRSGAGLKTIEDATEIRRRSSPPSSAPAGATQRRQTLLTS